MVDGLLLGLEAFVTLENILYLFAGCVLGTVVGILPGFGPAASISLLVPITYFLSPVTGLTMLAGIYYGSQYGGSTTAILLNVPGESSSIMTIKDGYKMTQQGRPGIAILAAGIASFTAGIFATFLILVFSPILADIAFSFGPAEYTGLILLGFVAISFISNTDLIKSLGMTCMGILIGCIGTDTITGFERFTFNNVHLSDGVGFTAVAIGLFAIGDILYNLNNNLNTGSYKGKLKLWPKLDDIKRMIAPISRGSIIGSFLGLLPGGGITLSSYAAYIFEKKVSKNKDEIGNGAIEGVCAPEASNNASSQTGYIPLLALGLPENAAMAIMLGAFLMYGIVPGPIMFTEQPDLFYAIVISMLVGNFILLILNVPLVTIWTKILDIPYSALYPFVLFLCCLGAYSLRTSVEDIMFLSLFGVIGYIALCIKIEIVPFILGFVLGPKFEIMFRRSLTVSDGDFSIFIQSPISTGLLTTTLIFLILGIYKYIHAK
jgi:putative tricarboxylic transport membrane protein